MKVFTFLLIIMVCLYNFGVRAAMDNSKHLMRRKNYWRSFLLEKVKVKVNQNQQ